MNNVDIAFIGGSGLYKIPGIKNVNWKKYLQVLDYPLQAFA